MKHWKRGILAAALCAVLLLGIAVPAFGTPSTVYLMAVNDTVMETTAENVPAMVDGMLYVPYTMLSIRDTGINLGVSAMYSTTRRTVLVSNGQMGVVFDLQSNTAKDLQDTPLPVRAMVRNSMVFLPIDWLCTYFGTISCSRVRSEFGIVVRVTNGAVVLRDLDFVDAAESQLSDCLQGYLATVETAPPETQTPAPTPGPGASAEPSDPPIQAEVLLALRWGEQGAEQARLLENRGERALFLFTCEDLRADDDGVRRVVAAGHTVGLALTGETAEDCLSQAEEGRRLLAAVARCRLLVVSADGLDGPGREALAQAGWAVWEPGLRGEDFRSGGALVEALAPQQDNYVEIPGGAGGAAFLRAALAAMEEEACRLRQVTAPVLG